MTSNKGTNRLTAAQAILRQWSNRRIRMGGRQLRVCGSDLLAEVAAIWRRPDVGAPHVTGGKNPRHTHTDWDTSRPKQRQGV